MLGKANNSTLLFLSSGVRRCGGPSTGRHRRHCPSDLMLKFKRGPAGTGVSAVDVEKNAQPPQTDHLAPVGKKRKLKIVLGTTAGAGAPVEQAPTGDGGDADKEDTQTDEEDDEEEEPEEKNASSWEGCEQSKAWPFGPCTCVCSDPTPKSAMIGCREEHSRSGLVRQLGNEVTGSPTLWMVQLVLALQHRSLSPTRRRPSTGG